MLRAENDGLREDVRRLREEPRTIEELARGQLGLIHPGEKLFIVTAPATLGSGSRIHHPSRHEYAHAHPIDQSGDHVEGVVDSQIDPESWRSAGARSPQTGGGAAANTRLRLRKRPGGGGCRVTRRERGRTRWTSASVCRDASRPFATEGRGRAR